MRRLLLIFVFLSFVIFSSSAFAVQSDQSRPPESPLPKDSLDIMAPSEPTLQQILNNLGYGYITVPDDTLSVDLFSVLDGQYREVMCAELAGYAPHNYTGWYSSGDPTDTHEVFSGTNQPGDTAYFDIPEGVDSIGLYLYTTYDTWYTQSYLNSDGGHKHAWIFATNVPNEFIVAWEDLQYPDWDQDHNDMVLLFKVPNQPPVVTLTEDFDTFLCEPETLCFVIEASDTDPQDTITIEKLLGTGTYTPVTDTTPITDTFCFIPDTSGSYMFVFKVTDKGGLFDTDTTIITVDLNDPPAVTLPADMDTFMCSAGTICIKPITATDPDTQDSITLEKIEGPGTYTPKTGTSPLTDSLCFMADRDTTYRIIFKVEDHCDEGTYDTMFVTVAINSPPVVTAPDSSKFFCDPDTIRFTVTATDSNAGDTLTLSGPGISPPVTGLSPLSAEAKIYVSSTGTYDYEYTVTDECNASEIDTSIWMVSIDSPPAVTAPDTVEFFLCDTSTLCFDITLYDPDDGLDVWVNSPGQYNSSDSSICFLGNNDTTYNFTIIVSDSCGKEDTAYTVAVVHYDDPPWISTPDTATFDLCDADTVCFPINVSDPDDHLFIEVTSPGFYSSCYHSVCFFADRDTIYYFTMILSDSCGRKDTAYTTAIVNFNDPPVVGVPSDFDTFLCDADTICFDITISDPDDNLVDVQVNSPFDYNSSDTSVCFFANTEDVYCCTVIVTDSCQVSDTGIVCIDVELNQPPVVTAPDSSKFLCGPDTIRFTVTATDSDAGDTLTLSGPGISLPATGVSPLSANIEIYVSSAGAYDYVYTVTDECNASDDDTATWNVTMNASPAVAVPSDFDTFLCSADTICFDITISDPDDNLVDVQVNSPFDYNSSDTSVCFFANTEDVYCCTVIVTDVCQVSDTGIVCIDVELNQPPVVTAPDSSKFLCEPDTIRFRVTATDPDAGDIITLSGPGIPTPIAGVSPVYADVEFNIDSSGTYEYVYQVANHCGFTDYDTATWIVTVNSLPSVGVPADFDTFLCDPSEICFDISISDLDDNITDVSVNPPFAYNSLDTSVCFTPTQTGVYACTVMVTDSCQASDYEIVNMTVDLNTAPLLVLDQDTSYHLCAVTENLCFEGQIWDDDPDPLSEVSIIQGEGTLSEIDDNTFEVCFLPATFDSTYQFVLRATDRCQEISTDTINITIDINDYPVLSLPDDTSLFMCDPASFCIQPIVAYDPNSGDTFTLKKIEGPGTFNPITKVSPDQINTSHCFTPQDKDSTYRFVFEVANGCGAVVTDTMYVTVGVNQPPTVTAIVASDTVEFKVGFEKCFNVAGNDPDAGYDNTLRKITGPGNFSTITNPPPLSGPYCWNPTSGDIGIHIVGFEIVDHCGDADTDWVWINVTPADTCVINVEIDQIEPGANPGEVICLPVYLETAPAIGGFKFLIEWDPNVLTLLGVERGDCIDDYDFMLGPHNPHYLFEKFSHEQLPCTDIHKKKVKLVGLADVPNGYQGYPIPENTMCSIACLKFEVKNDATLKGFKLPVKFEWDEALFDENTMSDPSGYIWYVSQNPNQFPYDTSGPNVAIEKVICFTDGGIRVDDTGLMWRGDVNLNEYAYEIADAICFANYFITGYLCTYGQEGITDYWYEISEEATDVTVDGITLSIADLVYMIRVIMELEEGMVVKAAPAFEVASMTTKVLDRSVVVSSDCDANIGAAAFVFKHSGSVSDVKNLSNMKLDWSDLDGKLRVLIWSQNADFVPAGASDLFSFEAEGAELVGVEVADDMGRAMKGDVFTQVVPKAFALKGNYPNPFNPTTHVAFALPEAGNVSLKIYNIKGQQVWSHSAWYGTGEHEITWQGKNTFGDDVASGIYFYKLNFGEKSATRKMVLVK